MAKKSDASPPLKPAHGRVLKAAKSALLFLLLAGLLITLDVKIGITYLFTSALLWVLGYPLLLLLMLPEQIITALRKWRTRQKSSEDN